MHITPSTNIIDYNRSFKKFDLIQINSQESNNYKYKLKQEIRFINDNEHKLMTKTISSYKYRIEIELN